MKYNGQIINGIFPLKSGIKYSSGDMFIHNNDLFIFTSDWSFNGELSQFFNSNGLPIGTLKDSCVSYIEEHRYDPRIGNYGPEALITTKSIEYFLRNIFDDRTSDHPIEVNGYDELLFKIKSIDHSGIWRANVHYEDEVDQTRKVDELYIKIYKYITDAGPELFTEIISKDLSKIIIGRVDEDLFASNDSNTLKKFIVSSVSSLTKKINQYNNAINNRIGAVSKYCNDNFECTAELKHSSGYRNFKIKIYSGNGDGCDRELYSDEIKIDSNPTIQIGAYNFKVTSYSESGKRSITVTEVVDNPDVVKVKFRFEVTYEI